MTKKGPADLPANELSALAPEIVEAPNAPELFASDVTGFSIVGGNVVLALESLRTSFDSGEIKRFRVVTARIVLPLAAAQGLAVGLHDYLARQGLSPSDAFKDGGTEQ